MTNLLVTIAQVAGLDSVAALTVSQAANRAAAGPFLGYRGCKSANTLRNHRATLNKAWTLTKRPYSIVGKYCWMNSLGVNTGKVAAEKSFTLRVIIASNPSAVAAACCTASS